MTDEWTVQVSPKIGDTLINVRGASVQEVVEAFEELADAFGKVTDALGVISAAGAASSAMSSPAAAPTPGAANWTPPATGGAAASPGNAPLCDHGVARSFKTTKTGKKLWECHLAVANWKDPNACKSTWIN